MSYVVVWKAGKGICGNYYAALLVAMIGWLGKPCEVSHFGSADFAVRLRSYEKIRSAAKAVGSRRVRMIHPIAYLRAKLFGVWYVWTEDHDGAVRLRRPFKTQFGRWFVRAITSSGGEMLHSGVIINASYLRRWKTAYGNPPCGKWKGAE